MVLAGSDDKGGERLDVRLIDQGERNVASEQIPRMLSEGVLVRDLQNADVVRTGDPRHELISVVPSELSNAVACLR